MKNILIGGDGLVGSHLVKLLREQGENCLVVDIKQDNKGSAYPADTSCQRVDITDRQALAAVPFEPDDIVYHLAARQYHDTVPSRNVQAWFDAVNIEGCRNVLSAMEKRGCSRQVYFSTDMVYGLPQYLPIDAQHPKDPIGEYGESKRIAEDICLAFRDRGMQITILRPRLILGPGRLGVLARLFQLIQRGLPVPLIGNGSNVYQMVSVFDCARAARLAVDAGLPGRAFNLGSANPPRVIDLLRDVIKEADSRSVLLKTPASLTKAALSMLGVCGVRLMHKEQYSLADRQYVVDIEETRQGLGWEPTHDDRDMLMEAYRHFENLKHVSSGNKSFSGNSE